MIITLTGILATFFSFINFLPQAQRVLGKVVRKEEIFGVSATGYAVLSSALSLFCVYGALTGSFWQMVSTGFTSIVCLVIMACVHMRSPGSRNMWVYPYLAAVFSFGAYTYLSSAENLVGIVGTVLTTVMFVPQAVETVRGVLRGDGDSDLTVLSASMQMVLTPGSWCLYGVLVGAFWTWVSSIPQILCGGIVLTALYMSRIRAKNLVLTLDNVPTPVYS